MKKIFYLALPAALLFSACTKDISRFNEFTKSPAAVPAGSLFSNATRTVSDNMASASVNTNIWRFTVKHWAMAVYQDETQYDITTRNIPQTWWTVMYRDVLNDYNDAAKVTSADATLIPGVKANKLAIIDIMQVYTYQILVNTFGNVPYSEAIDPTKTLFPKYDDAKTIYIDLMKRLAADIAALNTASAGFSSSEDLIYKGDVSKWIKFANTLQMKFGMILADSDAPVAKSAVESADAKAFASNADNAQLTYLGATPNTNPLYADIIIGGRSDYLASKDLMDFLIGWNDPRTVQYFRPNNAGVQVGGIVGKVNTFADYSKPSAKVSAATAPQVFADYAEAEFLRAEAKERGFTVAGTAEEHYNNAITASILYWGGTAAEAAAYLAQPSVAYTTATGSYKQKIGTQKWIALYNRSFDAWTELRRFDFPVLTAPVGAYSGFPNRFSYPNNEQQLNPTNYTASAAIMGADKVEFKLFWDKN